MADDTFEAGSASSSSNTRRGVIYELFILGELMGGPHHGYLLREILGRILGPFQQMSWGALYPLIRQLEGEGLIEALPMTAKPNGNGSRGRGRQRNAYQITDTGRKRFFALLLHPGAFSPDYHDLFIVKLNYFGHITPDQRRALLAHFRSYVQFEQEYLRSGKQLIERNGSLPTDEKVHIQRLIRYRMSNVEARLSWIDDEMARLEHEDGQ